MKKIILALLVMVSFNSFSAISEQDKVGFKNMYGGVIKPETSRKILDYCEKNETNIGSCLGKIKSQQSKQKSATNGMGYYSQCCWNVSGQWGEYVYMYGQNLCVPPCGH